VCFFEVVLFTFLGGCLMGLSTMSYVIFQRDGVVLDLQVLEVVSSKSSNFVVVENVSECKKSCALYAICQGKLGLDCYFVFPYCRLVFFILFCS
jgi:hypothetical protein